MRYILAVAALIVGTLIGLQLPDADRVFTLFLVHRSVLSHSFLLPLGLYLIARGRERWLMLGSVGVSFAVAVHLAFDLFPRRWVGFAQLYAPLFGRVDTSLSVLWLAVSIVVCCALGLTLVRDRRDLALSLVAMAWGFVVAAQREAVWFMPLACLTLAFALAAFLPNPVIDGRATARRWAAAARRMGQP
jgi:nitrate/nitrite transporter NarK